MQNEKQVVAYYYFILLDYIQSIAGCQEQGLEEDTGAFGSHT